MKDMPITEETAQRLVAAIESLENWVAGITSEPFHVEQEEARLAE